MNKYEQDHHFWLSQIIFRNDQEAYSLLWDKCNRIAVEKAMKAKRSPNGVRFFNTNFELKEKLYNAAMDEMFTELSKKHKTWLQRESLNLIGSCVSVAVYKACDVIKSADYKKATNTNYPDIIPEKTFVPPMYDETKKQLKTLLASKPDKWLTILEMHIEGYKLEEIATHVNMGLASLKATLSNIRRYLAPYKHLFTNF